MRTKNLIVGLAAIISGIASSTATPFMAPAEYAKQETTCRAITSACQVAAPNLCFVRITNATSQVILPAYDDPACLVRTGDTHGIPISAQFE